MTTNMSKNNLTPRDTDNKVGSFLYMNDYVKFREMLSDIVPRIPEIVAGLPSIDVPWKTHLVNMYNYDPTGAASMLVLEVKMNQLWSDFFSVLRLLDMENVITKWFSSVQQEPKN